MHSKNSELNEEELRIVQEYLNGKSIRTLAFECPGYSRTKISNIIKKYQNENPKYAEIIEAKKIKDKTHRNDADTIWTEKDTIEAYNQIKNGKNLVDVADIFGRTSTFIKRQILSYIKDEVEKKQFLENLQANQSNKENLFSVVSNEEKKKIIFDKLNFRRIQNNKNEYSKSVLERKYFIYDN